MIAEKICPTCGDSLRGRADKRFCNDYCRNTYHNGVKARLPSPVRSINSHLTKNRKILDELFEQAGPDQRQLRVSKLKLAELGFQFAFYTHIRETTNGPAYTFCYDYGYKSVAKDMILVVKSRKS